MIKRSKESTIDFLNKYNIAQCKDKLDAYKCSAPINIYKTIKTFNTKDYKLKIGNINEYDTYKIKWGKWPQSLDLQTGDDLIDIKRIEADIDCEFTVYLRYNGGKFYTKDSTNSIVDIDYMPLPLICGHNPLYINIVIQKFTKDISFKIIKEHYIAEDKICLHMANNYSITYETNIDPNDTDKKEILLWGAMCIRNV